MKTIAQRHYCAANLKWFLLLMLLFLNFHAEATNNNSSSETMSTIERHRVWINATDNMTGAFSQTLFGYRTGATNGVDQGLDGAFFNDGSIALASLIGNDRYAIQFRGLDYSPYDVIPLSFMSTYNGTFTFALDHAVGFFLNTNQPIYILDTETNLYTDLKTTSYSFSCSVGMHNERFKLVFYNPTQVSSLGNTNHQFTSNNLTIYQDYNDVAIQSNSAQLKSLSIFNLNGQMIYENNNVMDVRLRISGLNTNYQALFIKAITVDGTTITKKFLAVR
ncbi:T9SS type A sorting domain-containing protein [Flavobacterium sp.]|uniref:T9SS type A sorting domain-containing protein n=1 Tax=Flavobacterium sp. TaxID=239 RepID=UPI0025DC7086|nr:T9SS type A sorting domain-containing protein [Flavobacterium sp.]